ncbi:AAA family ATPase [Legionella pneumophila]|nr:AAA family ATPase [Legionella pneumophila]HCJ4395165.1 AAA family ATPase [Legionella pneumophila]
MNKIKFSKFQVKKYRSLLDVCLDISDSRPVVICGENNIGKTNFLRALNVFFNHIYEKDNYQANHDIPHHIFYGSGGAGAKTELIGTFIKDGEEISLQIVFKNNCDPHYFINGKSSNIDKVKDILTQFHYLYVESHNIVLPNLISVILEKDGLMPLDAKRSKQSAPLVKLAEFIELSQHAIADIENEINDCFKQLTNFDGILKGKELRIKFAEFDKLRDVVKNMTSITLYDGNNHGIAAKGSGAQRAVFLALMQFISQNSKKNIVWGIDEPEAFLQPRLQKQISNVMHEIVEKRGQPVILTTHSQHFIKLNELNDTHLFVGEISDKTYQRRPNQNYYEMSAFPFKCKSNYEKATLIKNHLGITNNDGWEVLPHNILVEGEEDKRYLETLFSYLNLPIPNIVWSGGASKIAGYLQYYDHFARDLNYKPNFICIFDNDNEGREQKNKLKPNSYKNLCVNIESLPRHDGVIASDLDADWEIEDFLPYQMMIIVINQILKKDKYKIIKKDQINDRNKPAHYKKQILRYAEECTSLNNPDSAPFLIDNPGRKKQICQIFCDQANELLKQNFLASAHEIFLKKLIG